MANNELDLTDTSVTTLDIGNRALNVFRKYGIRTLADLVAMEPTDLTDMRGFGPGCLEETIVALRAHGLKLKEIDFVARR